MVLGTLRFALKALQQSSPCGGHSTAAKKEPDIQEEVPGGLWETVFQISQGTCLVPGKWEALSS